VGRTVTPPAAGHRAEDRDGRPKPQGAWDGGGGSSLSCFRGAPGEEAGGRRLGHGCADAAARSLLLGHRLVATATRGRQFRVRTPRPLSGGGAGSYPALKGPTTS
jgi:hypothetical protein